MPIELKENKMARRVITIVAVIVSALSQTLVIQVFIRPANLLSGGSTGVVILIGRTIPSYGYSFSTSLDMLVLNTPVAFLCSKSISVWLMSYSTMQVFLASSLSKVLHFQPISNDVMLNVVSGGFLYGIEIVIALRGNASAGDTNFIALYVSNKTGCSIWEHVLARNVLILCIFGSIFGWIYAGYSILFQYISTQAISAFYYRYERVTPQIIVSKAEAVTRACTARYHHGISCVDAAGGYSYKKMNLFHTVVSSHEVPDIVALMREEDSYVIVNMIKTESFYGGFYQASME